MIQVAIENLAIEANYNFIILKEHHEKYNIKNVLSLCAENCNIIELDHVTEGAHVHLYYRKNLLIMIIHY